MLRRSLAILLTLSILFLSSGATAQQDKTPLTNDDIVKMLKVGLPESTVVTVIQVSPTNFDTSPEAIQRLRKKGASQKVIEAVLAARAIRLPLTSEIETLTTTTTTARTFSINSLVSSALTLKPQTCRRGLKTVADCHENDVRGCTDDNTPNYDVYLSVLKNQMPPTATEPERLLNRQFFERLEPKTPRGLGKENHAEFARELADLGEGKIYSLIGYLYHVKKMDEEVCNCKLTYAEEAVDFHMWVGFDEQAASDYLAGRIKKKQLEAHKKEGVVVEMSPYYRFKNFRGRWTYDRADAVVGRQVKVVGMLLMDNEHNIKSQNCGYPFDAPTSKCWRASAWELHPVTHFYVCEGNRKCGADSPNWKPL